MPSKKDIQIAHFLRGNLAAFSHEKQISIKSTSGILTVATRFNKLFKYDSDKVGISVVGILMNDNIKDAIKLFEMLFPMYRLVIKGPNGGAVGHRYSVDTEQVYVTSRGILGAGNIHTYAETISVAILRAMVEIWIDNKDKLEAQTDKEEDVALANEFPKKATKRSKSTAKFAV